MKKTVRKVAFYLLIVLGLVGADQLVKLWVYQNLRGQEALAWIPNVFELTYVENRGAAFGMLNGWSWLFYLLTPICVVCIGYLLYKISAQKKFWPAQLACLLIIAGAIGNLIDRLARGFVVDMFYFKLIDFAVFNVADSYIVVGVILIAAMLLWNKEFGEHLFPEKSRDKENEHGGEV